MDVAVPPARGVTYEEEPHRGLQATVDGEDEQSEKKPVLKKVKDKVKKIKHTIGKKVHGDNHHHEDVSEDNNGYEEDDGELEVDPEIHCRGVPLTLEVHETAERVGAVPDIYPASKDVVLGDSTGPLEEDPAAPVVGPKACREGREEIDVSDSLLRFLDEMIISDEVSRSHDQSKPETRRPEEQHQQQSYTNKLSSATLAAKDAVAGTSEYGEKVASTVYEKVAEAGTAVMEKVKPKSGAAADAAETDKGVSMREYIAEKLRPGEEDKALSEVISDTIQKRKEEEKETMVTGSEEMRARTGMVEKIRGAVTLLFSGALGSGASPVDDKQLKGEFSERVDAKGKREMEEGDLE